MLGSVSFSSLFFFFFLLFCVPEFSSSINASDLPFLSTSRVFMMVMGPLIPLKAYLNSIKPTLPTNEGGPQDNESITQAYEKIPSAGRKASGEGVERKVVKLATVGLGTGFLAGLFGVGGGALTVPAVSMIW